LNLTNNAATDDVATRDESVPSQLGVPVSFVLPRRLMIGAKLSF
jgi:hypothetical protein